MVSRARQPLDIVILMICLMKSKTMRHRNSSEIYQDISHKICSREILCAGVISHQICNHEIYLDIFH